MGLDGVRVTRHTAAMPVRGVILPPWELPARVGFLSLNLPASSFIDDTTAQDCSVAWMRMPVLWKLG